MKSIHRRALLGIILGLVLSGCTAVSTPSSSAPASAKPWGTQVVDRLYCGRTIPRGGQVADDAWAKFLAEVVTPRFPAGFTIFPAQGQWRSDNGQIDREQSTVIEIAHPDDPASDRAIQEIATSYKQRFNQEAVLQIRQPADVKFF